MELINEHTIGVARGTQVESAVMANFKAECNEVGLYLAMARQAQREGYPEIAEALKTIAWEEAMHAAQFAEMNGMIAPTLKENLEMMVNGEVGANKGKKEAAKMARECNCDPAHDFFDESSRDEARHARMLMGIMKRFF
ncbi:MAG: rubrerythrin family protein [Alphaproteobacteria bacterium]|uniref:Rubrerythrin family protein n=1 Tax=Candidatus Nitrobium versatile TaxID=2884831 RepID=A0A953J864_9BACT|nr:rubrerythrin family protein [Candidatus Nitrobium versatile]